MTIDIRELELMSFPEASLRWGKERTYVTQQYTKYRHKFLKGTTATIGNGKKKTFLITREGMEHLMNQTEAEANDRCWLVRKISDWTVVTFEVKVNSELEARELITDRVIAELKSSDYLPVFERIKDKPIKYRVKVKQNIIYTYEKLRK